MPRLVSFRGLIQNFRRASPPLSYESSTPGTSASLNSLATCLIRESRFRNREIFCWAGGGHLESENILLVESRILGFGIQNTAQEIRNTTKGLESGIQVALTRIGIQYLEWSIHGMESRIQGCLGFPHMGLLSLVLRLTAMNSAGSRREAGRAGPPYFFFSFLRPLPADPPPPPIWRSGSATNESNTKNPDFAQLET